MVWFCLDMADSARVCRHCHRFDTVFAVFFPALVLVYSIATFHGDLKAVKILQQFFPPNAYERTGRIFVDARQINTFSAGYESLLLLDPRSIFLQIGFNLLTCLRWHRIMRALLERARLTALQRRQQHSQAPNPQGPADRPQLPFKPMSAAAVAPLADESPAAVKQSQPTGPPRPAIDKTAAPKRAAPAVIGVTFLAFGVACITSAAVAIRSAQAACEAYSSCILVSYVWPPIGAPEADGSLVCNCLAFVDRELAPNASKMLPDVTLELAEVARAGSLETIQLVNRKLNGTLPDEVSECTNLRSLYVMQRRLLPQLCSCDDGMTMPSCRRILIYTGIETLPAWANETFTQLEYL